MRIGVFDSGLGGLIMLRAIGALLPEYDYIYYGDTLNLPYGDKSEEEIYKLTRHAVLELFKRDCALVIIACNTASAESLRNLQDTVLKGEYKDRRILGVIIPTVEEFIASTATQGLLIGTVRTVDSQKYGIELLKRGEIRILHGLPTPGLVPLIEAGDLEGAYAYFKKVVDPEIGDMGVLILGCTHYSLLTEWIRDLYPHLKVLSQDEIVPGKVLTYLKKHPEIKDQLSTNGTCEYIITGDDTGYLNRVRE